MKRVKDFFLNDFENKILMALGCVVTLLIIIVDIIDFTPLKKYLPQIYNYIQLLLLPIMGALITTIKKFNMILNGKRELYSLPFSKAFHEVFSEDYYDEVKIFAYTGAQYAQEIKNNNNVHIKNLTLLLRFYNAKRAYSSYDSDIILDYQRELRNKIKIWESLRKKGKIENLEIKFYDDEPFIHFCIVNSNMLLTGLLSPTNESADTLNCTILKNTELIRDYVRNYTILFNAIYDRSKTYSGLEVETMHCELCKKIQVSHSVKIAADIVLYENNSFVITVDQLPVSEFHYLISSKDHIYSLIDVCQSPRHLEDLLEIITMFIKNFILDNILLFEHGDQINKHGQYEFNSGKSVTHFHMHCIYPRKNIIDEIDKQNFESFELENLFNNLHSIHEKNVAGNYLFVFDGKYNKTKFYTVSRDLPSQYLRAIAYRKMSEIEKKIYNYTEDDGYDWKIYGSRITNDDVERHKFRLGINQYD